MQSTAESEAGLGLSVAAIETDVSVVVSDEGQVTQVLGDVDGTIFTVAVVEGIGSRDDTVEEIVDGLVEGPSTADGVVSSEGQSSSNVLSSNQSRGGNSGRSDGSTQSRRIGSSRGINNRVDQRNDGFSFSNQGVSQRSNLNGRVSSLGGKSSSKKGLGSSEDSFSITSGSGSRSKCIVCTDEVNGSSLGSSGSGNCLNSTGIKTVASDKSGVNTEGLG